MTDVQSYRQCKLYIYMDSGAWVYETKLLTLILEKISIELCVGSTYSNFAVILLELLNGAELPNLSLESFSA